MELWLQFGHGMMGHCKHLLDTWGDATVILSPRDLTDKQLENLSADLNDEGGGVLVDPQFYNPAANHEKLTAHDYWPASYGAGTFWSGAGVETLVKEVFALNNKLKTKHVLLPGLLTKKVDDDWLNTFSAIIKTKTFSNAKGKASIYATVAISSAVVGDDKQIHDLLEAIRIWPVDGIYLVCQHPQDEYLVEDPSWLANVLDLVGGIRLSGKKVILGYCGHQMLIAGVAGANAICSGTWLNVRTFPVDKFSIDEEGEMKQRATWYYCPTALSEYKISFLDIAKKVGVLDDMAPPKGFDKSYCGVLFSSPQPSLADFGESAAFRHYLSSLRTQAAAIKTATFDDTVKNHETLMDNAESLLKKLKKNGIKGQGRDFADCPQAHTAAVQALVKQRGPTLRRAWNKL